MSVTYHSMLLPAMALVVNDHDFTKPHHIRIWDFYAILVLYNIENEYEASITHTSIDLTLQKWIVKVGLSVLHIIKLVSEVQKQ